VTYIKICGIKEEAHARAAAAAGADFIGLVFAARSPRQVSAEQARKIVAALRQGGDKTEAVGVFVNAPAEKVNHIAAACRLDRVQLSGDEPWEYCREIERPIIKAVRLGRRRSPEAVGADLDYGTRLLAGKRLLFLLDNGDTDKYGGTGRTFDWGQAKPLAGNFPVIIAGGLTAENVAGAIRTLAPWGVDVSSGVETKGVKDMMKIEKFIKTVRQADGR
jgi:phosphoribosylanthranilate isomerase